MRRIFYIMLLCVCAVAHAQQKLRPSDYGWNEAKSGAERLKIMYKLQSDAIKKGVAVDYSGIKEANLEIAEGCPVIPLADTNDFGGMVINVRNTSKRDYLFRHVNEVKEIAVDKKLIDSGDFSSVSELAKGEYMLIITDQNAWGDRKGYSDRIERRDILHIKDGRAQNEVIMPYNNSQSNPKCEYVAVRKTPLVVRNLTVNRAVDDDYPTYVVDVRNTDKVLLENITINTPESERTGDMAIRVVNCMDVTLKDITIKGSYSTTKKWGYGFNLNNLYRLKVQGVYGHAPWGVFGNYCISKAVLEDCDVNRWDTHHYGKDMTARRCTFTGKSNAMSSVYGEVRYDTCRFVNHVPLAIRGEYYAHVPVTVTLNGCTVHSDNGDTRLGSVSMSDDEVSTRKELKTHHVPTLILQNTTFSVGSPAKASKTINYRKITSLNTINSKVSTFVNKLMSNLGVICPIIIGGAGLFALSKFCGVGFAAKRQQS